MPPELLEFLPVAVLAVLVLLTLAGLLVSAPVAVAVAPVAISGRRRRRWTQVTRGDNSPWAERRNGLPGRLLAKDGGPAFWESPPLGDSIARGLMRTLRTFSSPSVCFAYREGNNGNGAGGGGGADGKGAPRMRVSYDNSIESQAERSVGMRRIVRRPFGLGLYHPAFDDLIDRLGDDEKRFTGDMKAELSKFDCEATKYGSDDDMMDHLAEERVGVVEWHGGTRPLLARYGVLVTACFMAEWCARSFHMHDPDTEVIAEFLRYLSDEQDSNGKNRRTAQGREWLGHAMTSVRREFFFRGGKEQVKKMLQSNRNLAGKIPHEALQMVSDLFEVRHVIVHSGGNLDMTKYPEKAEDSAKRLGFTIGDTLNLPDNSEDGEHKMRFHGKHILIGKGQLDKHVKQMGMLLDGF